MEKRKIHDIINKRLRSLSVLEIKEDVYDKRRELVEELIDRRNSVTFDHNDTIDELKQGLINADKDTIVIIKGYSQRPKDEQKELARFFKGFGQGKNQADVISYYSELPMASVNTNLKDNSLVIN